MSDSRIGQALQNVIDGLGSEGLPEPQSEVEELLHAVADQIKASTDATKEAFDAVTAADIPTSDDSDVQTKLTSYASTLSSHTTTIGDHTSQLAEIAEDVEGLSGDIAELENTGVDTVVRAAIDTIKVVGKNKFDKSTANLTGYVNTGNGTSIIPDAILKASDFIPVEPSTNYVSTAGVYWILYNSSKTRISSTASVRNATMTAETTYVRVDFQIGQLDTLQIEEGDTSTEYVAFKYEINQSLLPVNTFGGVLIVSKDGKGNYTTISSAVAAAVDGSVILVMPGSYEEHVACAAKNVSIIGLDRQKCILWNSVGSYAQTPLYISKGHVKNMTIKAVYDDEVNYTGISSFAYAVHIDNNGANGELIIEDCECISDFNDVFGCGATNNHVLVIKNCTAEATGISELVADPNAFAYHGSSLNTVATVVLDNNRFSAVGNEFMFRSDGTANNITIHAYHNAGIDAFIPYPGTVYNLASDSYGNQASELNYVSQ